MIRPFAKRLAGSDTLRVVLGNGVGAFLGLLVLVVLTRTLGAEGYGQIAPALAIIDLGQLLIDTLLAAGVVTVAARHSSASALATGFRLRAGAAALYAAAFILGAVWLGPVLFPKTPGAAGLVCAAGLAGGLIAIQSALAGGLQIQQRFARVALVAASKNAIRLLAILLALSTGILAPQALGLVIAAAGALALILAFWISQPGYLRGARWDPQASREMLAINKWMALAAIAIISGRIDVLLLTVFADPTDVAFYASSMQLCIAVGVISQAIVTTQLPKVAKYQTRDEIIGYLRAWARRAPIAAIPVLVMPLIADPVVPLILGPEFAGAAGVFVALFASAMITLIMNPVLVVLFPIGSAKLFGLTVLFQTLAKWGIAFVLVADTGALVLAWADVGTKLAASAIILFLLFQKLRSRHGPFPA